MRKDAAAGRRDGQGSDEGRRFDDDRALASRIAGGDDAAFMTVYDRYGDMLFGTAMRFFRDRDTAADVVQETMLAVWRRSAQFDPGQGSLGAWMMGIARNRSIDRLRAEARRPRLVRPAAEAGVGDDAADPLAWAARALGAPDPDEPANEAARRWVRALLATTLAELRPEDRDVLVLAYDHGLSQSEVAIRLGLPIGTVKSRTRRALAGLRNRLATVPDLLPGRSQGAVAPEWERER
ncbi:MAG: sigma-70 family RNA polymerase sigma factor [Chloroflexi bacterium]|nr:sigma-70 family RNA polymerase sigma factor [Chloroflexota bacterium]